MAEADLKSPCVVNVGVFSAGVSILGNTLGTTGTVSSQLVFAGGNNVTLSQSINGQSATITIIGGAGGAANIGIAAGSQTATSGTALFQDANSISFGMNNSSLITASYEMQSHDSVYHTGIIGAESQISFDPVAGHDHDGVDSKLIITPQYLEVSEIAGAGESGKQYTSIATAIAAAVAGGAGSAKPYVIRVYPGTYTEPQLVMESYVAVIGSGMFNTIITALDPTNHFIIGATNSYIRDCAIVGPTTNFMAAIYHDKISSSPFTAQDLLIRQGYYGVWANSATTGGNVHCINVNNWYNGTIMHTFMYATDFGTIVAINSTFMCGPAAKITRGFACDGSNAEIYMDLCSFRNTPTIPLPNDAVFVDNGGKVKLVACTLSIGTNAIHVGANGTGGYVIAVGCNIRNEPAMGYIFTNDILMDSAGTMQYTGSCTKSKITITNPAAATFSANFTDSTTGEEGAVVYGELWLGTSAVNSIPLRDYGLTAYSSGWKIGGAVTRSGAPPSLDVSVALGSGYINTGTGVTRISWGPGATIKTCTADTSQWVYVDSAGTVTVSPIEPNYPDVILLAAIRTNNNHVVFLTNHDISLHQTVPTIYNYLEKIFGPVSFEGCTVTQTPLPGNELKVDFAVGKYFSGLQELQPATTSPVTFTYWYRKVGSSGWNTTTPGGGGSDFDTTQYDDNSGALAPLPGGKYKKDLLIVVKNDVGTEFHVIYGQQYFDTADQAQVTHVFEIPDPIQEHGLQVAGIVVLSGAGVIASIVDERSKFVSGHNDLRELQGGDSIAKQYYHLNYNDYSSRNQKIVASLLTAGNTAGAMAVISTGTMYLAGGNNITLSQNANSVTISGPNMAIAAGGVTTAASTFTFGDTNGVSFQISNGSIVGSIGIYLTSQSNQALSGSNTSFTFQTATFGNSNGLSFYVTNGSMVGSYTVPTQSAEPRVISLNGTSGELSLVGASNITVSALNGSTITIYGPANILNSFSVSGNTGTTGSSNITGGGFVIAGGSNITLSQSNNSISIHGPSPSAAGIAAIGNTASSNAFTSGSVIFSASTNITVNTSVNGASQYIQLSVADPAAALGVSAIANSETTYTSGLLILSDYANITISSSVNGGSQYYRFSVGAGAGIGGIADSAATITNQTVQFNNANNVSFGLNGSTMTASASYSQSTGIGGLYASGIATTFTSGSVGFSGANNITVSTAAQAIIISGANTHAQQTGISGISATDTLYASGTVLFTGSNMITVRSSGAGQTIILDATHPLQTFVGGIAGSGAATITGGTVQFANLNGISFGLNGSTMTASHNALTSQSTAPSGLYASGIATTFTSGIIGFSGSNNITILTAAQAIIISGPNTHAVQVGISSIGAAGTTYTSGGVSLYGSGIISLSSTTGQGFVISAAGVISLNGSSSTLTIMAGNNMSISNVGGASQISIINVLSSSAIAQVVSSASSAGSLTSRFALADHIHAGIGGLGVSNTGTILGDTGTRQGTIVIAASGNITASQSTGAAGVHTIWLSVPAGGGGGIASIGVVGSESTFTSGDVVFSGLANITINTSAIGANQYVQISAPAPGAAAARTLSYWDNAMGETASGGFGLKTFQQNMLWVFPLDIADRYFPGDMTVNTMMLNMSASGSSATLSAAFTTAVRFALYERTNNTQLTLRNSVLTSFTQNATNQSSLWVGQRWWTVHSSIWSAQPVLTEGRIYYGALMMSSAGSSGATFQVIGNYGYSTASRSGTFGVTSASATSRGFNLFFGHYGTTTNAFPNFINYNQINKASASGNFQPHLVFNNLTGVI